MIVNFRVRRISRDIHKLARKPSLIKKINREEKKPKHAEVTVNASFKTHLIRDPLDQLHVFTFAIFIVFKQIHEFKLLTEITRN